MKRLLFPIIGLVLIVLTVAQVYAVRSARAASQTAAAPAQARPRVTAEGRLVAYPGAQVTVGSDFAGTIERLSVQERDHVKRGDLIAVVRADDTRAALREARARVGEAEADIRLFELERSRARELWRDQVGTRAAWDKSERDLDAARARRESAAADVRRLEAVVEKSEIRAPIDGVVIERVVHPGETIAAGAPLLTIADLSRTRVEAEVDEFDGARVKVGGTAAVTAEGYDGQGWRGTVEEIPDSVTNRRLKPQDTSKPVDTRVLLVKVALAGPTPLKLGQRVELSFE